VSGLPRMPLTSLTSVSLPQVLRIFFGCELVLLVPPLEWIPSLPLVAATLIASAPQGAESEGSSCLRVIGALILF